MIFNRCITLVRVCCLQEHRSDPRRSKLKRIVPTVGSFFTPLKLVEAFKEYDATFHLSRRKYIPPNFAELRHILNIAQIHASAEALRLITFDADGTLYADGHHIEQDNEMIQLFIALMKSNIDVAIVTAAGYPGDASKFENRIQGLLAAFKKYRLPANITNRWVILVCYMHPAAANMSCTCLGHICCVTASI